MLTKCLFIIHLHSATRDPPIFYKTIWSTQIPCVWTAYLEFPTIGYSWWFSGPLTSSESDSKLRYSVERTCITQRFDFMAAQAARVVKLQYATVLNMLWEVYFAQIGCLCTINMCFYWLLDVQVPVIDVHWVCDVLVIDVYWVCDVLVIIWNVRLWCFYTLLALLCFVHFAIQQPKWAVTVSHIGHTHKSLVNFPAYR